MIASARSHDARVRMFTSGLHISSYLATRSCCETTVQGCGRRVCSMVSQSNEDPAISITSSFGGTRLCSRGLTRREKCVEIFPCALFSFCEVSKLSQSFWKSECRWDGRSVIGKSDPLLSPSDSCASGASTVSGYIIRDGLLPSLTSRLLTIFVS